MKGVCKFLLIQFYLIVKAISQCDQGCNTCEYDYNALKYICKGCISDFEYNQEAKLCIYQKCLDNQYLDIDKGIEKRCVSICGDSNISDSQTKTCAGVNKCSENYITKAIISNNQILLDIYPYSQEHYLIKYNGFFNVINAESGQFIVQITVDSKVILSEYIFNQLLAVKSDNTINQWHFDVQEMSVLNKIYIGIINSSSVIKKISENLILVTSFDESKKIIYLNIFRFKNNKLQYLTNFEINITDSKVSIFDSIVLLVTQSNVTLLEIQDKLISVELSILSDNIICPNLIWNDLILGITKSPDLTSFYIFVSKATSIFVYSQIDDTCQEVSLISNLKKIMIIKQIQSSNSISDDLLLYQFEQLIQIKKYNHQIFTHIQSNQKIVDSLSYLQDNFIYLILLSDTNQVSLYQSKYQVNSNFNLKSQEFVKIVSAQGLRLLINKLNQIQLYVTGYDFQQINIQLSDTFKTQSITVAYIQQINSNLAKVNRVYFDHNTQLLFGCSNEGILTVWNSINSFKLQYFRDYVFPNDSCKNFLLFKSQYLVVLLSRQVKLFDLQQTKEKKFSTSLNSDIVIYSLQLTTDYILVAFDDCLNIINENFDVKFNYCSNDLFQLIKVILTDTYSLIMISKSNIQSYTIDFNQQLLISNNDLITTYSSINFIQYNQKFNIIFIYDQLNSQVVVLNEQLIILDTINLSNVSKIIDIYTILDDQNKFRYFTLHLTNVASEVYKYYINTLLSGDNSVKFLNKIIVLLSLNSVEKFTNSLNQIIYQITTSAPLSYTSLAVRVKWNFSTGFIEQELFTFYRDENFTNMYKDENTQIIYAGNTSGNIGLTTVIQSPGQIIYENTTPQSAIINIQQIYDIGRVFIIKKTLIIYDLYLSKYQLEITLGDQGDNSSEYIQGFQYSKKLKLVLCFKSQKVLIIYFSTNTPQTKLLQNFDMVSNIYLDQEEQIIYIYGSSLSKFDLKLSSFKTIFTPQQYIIKQCYFYKNMIICQTGQDQVTIFDATANYAIIKTIINNSIEDQSFLSVDNQNDKLFIYKTSIQVYSFSSQQLSDMFQQNEVIIEFNFYNQHIVVFTSKNGYVFSRDKLQLIVTFSSSNNSIIQKSFYLSLFKHVIYYTNDASSGQIFVFSLDLLISLTPLKSTYRPTNIITSIFYDEETTFLCFTDNKGLLQTFFYGGSTSDNPIYIDEFFTTPASNMSFDLITGNLILNNNLIAYQINYNILINAFIRAFQSKKYQSVLYQKDQLNKFLIVSTSNILFNYSNQVQSYQTHYEDNVKGIYKCTGYNNIVIYFSNYFLIYQGIDDTINQKNYSQKVDNISISKFIDDEVILTQNQQMIHFSYSLNLIIKEIQFEQTEILKSSYLHQQKQFIVFGFSTGKITVYDKVKKQYFILSIQYSVSIIDIILNVNQIWIVQQYGKIIIFSVDQITSSNYQQQTPVSIIDLIQLSNSPLFIQQRQAELKQIVIDEIQKRIYVNFNKLKQIYSISTDNQSAQCKMLFPHTDNNLIVLSGQYILLQSQSQLNVHQRDTMQFLFFIRNNFRRQQISKVTILNEHIIIITYLKKLDVYSINEILSYSNNKDYFTLIDSQVLSFPQVIYENYNTTIQELEITGITLNNIFSYKYQIAQIQNSLTNQCITHIKVENPFQFKSKLLLIESSSSKLKTIQADVGDNFNFLNIIESYNSNFILQPQGNQDMYLSLKSLSYIQNKAYLKDFNLYFNEQGEYLFHKTITVIILEKIQILKQDLTQKQWTIQNIQKIVINNLTIDQVFDTPLTKRNLVTAEAVNDDEENHFIHFKNCTQIQIYNFQINDINLQGLKFLLKFEEVEELIIDNIIVQNNQFLSLIEFLIVKNLTIKNIKILSNIQQEFKQNQLFVLKGCLETYILNSQVESNRNIQFLIAFSEYQNVDQIKDLTNDVINLENMDITQNQRDGNQQINNMANIPFIEIHSSFVNLNHVNYTFNNMNVLIYDSASVIIQNSVFNNNTALEGGALQVKEIKGLVSFLSSKFINNYAYANGGAIIFDNTFNIKFDLQTQITQNTALIGGGIRIRGVDNFNLEGKSSITNNKASIFGNNIATFPNQVQVKQLHLDQGQFIFNSKEPEINGGIYGEVKINNFQSGGSLDVGLFLLDQEGRTLSFSLDMLKQGKYPTVIENEILQWNAHILSLNTELIWLIGESSVNYNSFNEDISGFVFKDLSLSSIPSSQQILILSYYLIDYIPKRKCKKGEIDHIQKGLIRICYPCKDGYYSYQEYKEEEYIENIECKKCPEESQVCEKDKIILKEGYWRDSDTSDIIVLCSKLDKNCNEMVEGNFKGCIEGYVGPLCEQCDYSGEAWNYRFSDDSSQITCQKCSSEHIQYLILILTTLLLLSYLFIQIIFIVWNFSSYQACIYIRLMNMLPISVTQQKNQNTFYIKCLMNYLQLQIILVGKLDEIPQVVTFLPQMFGQPTQIAIIDSICLVPQNLINEFGSGRIKLIIQQLYNLMLTSIIILLILICEKAKIKVLNVKNYFKYTALNFLYIFFQPDAISQITKFLTCRSIGGKDYFTQDLLIECNHQEYIQFQRYFGIPLLIFWTIMPGLIFMAIYKQSSKLQSCHNVFKYGYYFIEYQPSKYYWEFVRIYFRVIVVLFFTLYKNNQKYSHFIIIILILIYLSNLRKFKPFINPKMMRVEELSFLTLMIIIIIKNIKEQNSKQLAFQMLMMVFHISFIVYAVWIIVYNKLFTKRNIIGRVFLHIVDKIFDKNIQNKIKRHLEVSFKTFIYWKNIQKNLKTLINQSALSRINKHLSMENNQSSPQNKSTQKQSKNLQLDLLQQFSITTENKMSKECINSYPVTPQQSTTKLMLSNHNENQIKNLSIFFGFNEAKNKVEEGQIEIHDKGKSNSQTNRQLLINSEDISISSNLEKREEQAEKQFQYQNEIIFKGIKQIQSKSSLTTMLYNLKNKLQ